MYHIVDCRISNDNFAQKIFWNLLKCVVSQHDFIPNHKSSRIIDKQKRLRFFFLSIWLWKPTVIGSKIEKRSGMKSWHFGNQNWWTHAMKRSFVLKKLWCTLILPQTTDTQWRHKSKKIWKFGPIWQTKYASAVPKNLGMGVDFRPCSEGD